MRNFEKVKRVVIKIGTNTLSKNGTIDTDFIRSITSQVQSLLKSGRQVLIVTSGAIGMGAGELGITEKVTDMKMRQACAAIGQPILMHEYRKAFIDYKIKMAQVLITADVLNLRKTYLNLRNSVDKLLELGVVPVFNENDNISTEEIGSAFGDNDKLSALVASKIDADLLIILSDIDAFYDGDPKHNPDAKPISVVYEITNDLLEKAGASGSAHSTGGMKTKILAAKIAADAGCRIVIANGRTENIISRIMQGENLGTVFMPRRKLSNRKRWILNSTPAGKIYVDGGAVQALHSHKSLLPKGITKIEGKFEAGDVVMINEIAKAVCDFNSVELSELVGKHSSEIETVLGAGRKDTVAVPENIVFIDY
jgi:glutamate 5-kinase